jgi:hypothetical protein
MKKTNFLNTMMMLCLMSSSINTNAQELRVNQLLLPNDAVQLAQQELPNMLQLIEPESLKDFGFNASDNFSNLQVGHPFYVVNLPRTSGSSTSEIISVNTTTIMLPLILENTARCILYVSQEKGTWKVVGIGEGNYVASQQNVFNTSTRSDLNSEVIVSIPHLSQQYLMQQNDGISFKPLLEFEGSKMENISLAQLLELNNTIPLEANEVLNTNDTPMIDDTTPNNQK